MSDMKADVTVAGTAHTSFLQHNVLELMTIKVKPNKNTILHIIAQNLRAFTILQKKSELNVYINIPTNRILHNISL